MDNIEKLQVLTGEKDGVILSIALSEGALSISIFAPQDM